MKHHKYPYLLLARTGYSIANHCTQCFFDRYTSRPTSTSGSRISIAHTKPTLRRLQTIMKHHKYLCFLLLRTVYHIANCCTQCFFDRCTSRPTSTSVSRISIAHMKASIRKLQTIMKHHNYLCFLLLRTGYSIANHCTQCLSIGAQSILHQQAYLVFR
jgi:hypothetical protein